MSLDQGVYHLLLCLPARRTLRVGRLGRVTFPAGYYVYTGSALNGLKARIARHRRRRKRLWWHVDYLLQAAAIREVVTIPLSAALPGARRLECAQNDRVLALAGAGVIAPRFGSSDCRCASHLVYFGARRPQLRG